MRRMRRVSLIVLALLAAAAGGAQAQALSRERWASMMREVMPQAFCQQDAYFRACFAQDAAGCARAANLAVDDCLRRHEEHGATFFEGKLSTADPRPSITLIELLRRRLGDGVMIRVDTNHAYSLATARAAASVMPRAESVGNERGVLTASRSNR